MDRSFYSGLSDGCAPVDSGFLDSQTYGEYSADIKFPEDGDSYLSISGAGHHFLSAEQTFHTPSLGDEVFEIPPISLDPDPALVIREAVSHFELTDGSDGTTGPLGSRSLVSNLVVETNDPSFASTFVNSGPQALEQLSLGSMGPNGAVGGLLSSSALELGNSSGSHFNSTSPMTIDVQLCDVGQSLLESGQLTTINPSELALGLGAGSSGALEQALSATLSPAGSLQDEDMEDFKRSVLDDSMSLCSSSVFSSHMSCPAPSSSLAAARRGGGRLAAPTSAAGAAGGKKGRRRKDPNEPQKPVSAYALFFRDTQVAIKGQNPNASFGEVSKIVASMWDSLAEEQKQVYKRKTEAAKKEYLQALAAYKASHLLQPAVYEMEVPPPSPPPVIDLTSEAPPSPEHQAILQPVASSAVNQNTITNICASSIILDVPEVTTGFQAGAHKAPAASPTQTFTKIIIPKHILQAGGQVVTLLPGGVHASQPTFLVSSTTRQPPPLQQMQNAPPLPRLQQMAPAPPPLLAKPREGGGVPGHAVSIAATPPPPLQIKIVPASIQDKEAVQVILPDTEAASAPSVHVVNPAATSSIPVIDDVTEELDSDEDMMEVKPFGEAATARLVCVRAGCNNPAVDSDDWDREYCSNECVATHCKDVFRAWCSIRNQSLGTVK